MDRLLVIDPAEVILRFEFGAMASGSVVFRSAMYTMPVAFHVQAADPEKYSVTPPCGIIPPLGSIEVQIVLRPPAELPQTIPVSQGQFLVKSLIVTGGNQYRTPSLNWFSDKRKRVYSDHGLKIFFVGQVILTKLVREGDMEGIRGVLERKEDIVNHMDEQGRTALEIAVATGRPEIVRLLLEFAPDLVRRSCGSKTLIQGAAAAGQISMVEFLLANGAETNAKCSCGWTALHYAVAGGHTDVARVLLAKGSKADVATPDGRGAIHMAVAGGHEDCLRALLEMNCNVNLRGSDGHTALHISASAGNATMVRLLLDGGAKKYVKDRQGKTPLHCAMMAGHDDLLDILGQGDHLRCSARRGQLRLVRQSLIEGANVNGADQQGWTALHRAAFNGRAKVVKFLLSKGADTECQDAEGYTALHCAAEASMKDAVLLLVNQGANVNARSQKGITPLHLALLREQNTIARILIDRGANCKDVDRSKEKAREFLAGQQLCVASDFCGDEA